MALYPRALVALALKFFLVLSNRVYRRGLFRYGVAATTEHIAVLKTIAPATVIDVGANKGQFSLAVRGLFPASLIYSFEPLPSACELYERVFSGDMRVTLCRKAVAAEQGTAELHVTDRTDSSSLLRPGKGQADAFGVKSCSRLKVAVTDIGSALEKRITPSPVLLKIDVQGGELSVLKGVGNVSIDYIYVELSYVELYESQPLFDDVASYLWLLGYALVGVFNQVVTPAFGPTQADFLFKRSP